MISPLVILLAINLQRTQHHERPLKLVHGLVVASQAKLRDEQKYHYWSHVSPKGKDAWDFIGIDSGYEVIGENLAIGFKDTGSMVKAWMKSPTHRENILDRDFTDTGIAVGKQGNEISVIEFFANK